MAGINQTKADAREKAEQEIEQKKSLESKMLKDLKVYFKQIAHDFELFYASTGKTLSLNDTYANELDSLLKKNYREIAKQFGGKTREQIEQAIDMQEYEPDEEKQSRLNELIAGAIVAYILLRSTQITPKIIATAQEVIHTKVQAVISEKSKAGIAITQAQVANEVAKHIEDYGKNHAPVIAVTEVQNISETAKHIENIHINAIVEPEVMQKGSRKVWITAGDEKVRNSHEVLNGKELPYNEDFVTGMGNRMRFTGDMSLGAGLSDVINCRCTTIYKYATEFIKSVRNSIFRRKSK